MTKYLELIRRIWRLREAQIVYNLSRSPRALALVSYLEKDIDALVKVEADAEGLTLQGEPTESDPDAVPE